MPRSELLKLDSELVKKLVLDQCRLPRQSRVFSIGPYASRVSFASQQQRALNLVWALEGCEIEGKRVDLAQTRVAIVGGGIAGTTAAIGFLALRAAVTLYECCGDVLHVQENAAHRRIHPTVNAWPATRLDPTAALPFMHWQEGSAQNILAELNNSWKMFKNHVPFRANQKVLRVEAEDDGVRLKCKDLITKRTYKSEDAYDVVVFATGFGDEVICKGGEKIGYWSHEPDGGRLEDRVAGLRAGAHISIGGTGDGGLIEALRVICGDNFRHGALAVDLIKEIADENVVKQAILSAEAQLQAHWLNADIVMRNKFSADLEQAYQSARRQVEPLLEKYMKFAHEDRGRQVTLYGEFATAFTSMSAPIHKLMIAFAMHKQKIRYVQARAVQYYKGRKKLAIVAPIGDHFPDDNDLAARVEVDSGLHVSRQGNRPPINEIFTEKESHLLRLQQAHIGNYVFSGLYPPEFFARGRLFDGAREIDVFGATCKTYVESRKKKVEELLAERINNPAVILREDPEAGWQFVLLKDAADADDVTERNFKEFMRGNGPPYRLYAVDIVTGVKTDQPAQMVEL